MALFVPDRVVETFREETTASGAFADRRRAQTRDWLYTLLEEGLRRTFFALPAVKARLPAVEEQVLAGREQRFVRMIETSPRTVAFLIRQERSEDQVLRLLYLLHSIEIEELRSRHRYPSHPQILSSLLPSGKGISSRTNPQRAPRCVRDSRARRTLS